ncbi:hypothetical protein ACTVZO_41300 [Streptomyces sp. IBSNAI002]|uniref:hypothetical protein n=1 Tax=Streptomyces sp. IBSNAI002 TaxID=3457500 RepID=UPI003FCF1254
MAVRSGCCTLKSFEVEAPFRATTREVAATAVKYVTQEVKVPAEVWAAYDWQDDRT